jgi:hypothetical protein
MDETLRLFCGVKPALAEEGACGLAPAVEDAGRGSFLSACREWKSWTALRWKES